MDIRVLVIIPGKKPGARIGMVRFYESGYYPTDLDKPEWTNEQAEEFAREFNELRGIGREVAESAFDGSMFGWHCPAASRAIEHFKAATLAEGAK